MPTDAQRRNLASAHHAEVQALKEQIEFLTKDRDLMEKNWNEAMATHKNISELEKQLENAFSVINYWKEEAEKYKILYETVKKT